MKYFDKSNATGNVIMVKVNGIEYPTMMYGAVQRFVPNEAVYAFVNSNIDSPTRGEYTLNELALDVLEKRVSLEDYIAFYTMIGYSVSGFVNALESIIGLNCHLFPGDVEDYFKVENPLWTD